MSSSKSDTGKLISSIHRSIFGFFLAIAGFGGLAWGVDGLSDGNVIAGLIGVALGLLACCILVALFYEALRER